MGKGHDQGDDSAPKKPRKGRFKDTTGRLRGKGDTRLGHRASLDWQTDRHIVCDARDGAPEALPVEALKEALSHSRTAAALMTGPGTEALEIHYDPQVAVAQFRACGERQVIALNPCRPRGDLLNLLVRELRRAWQHRNGALVNPLTFDPDEAVLLNRAQAADALMMSVKVAWELKLNGDAEPWDWLSGSPAADIGRTFEIKAQSDFRTLNNGEASRAAYDKFFEGNRTKAHDKTIIHQMLLDESGYMHTSGKATPHVSPDLFARLGALPDGANYLSSSTAARAPTDMCYATVEDRSNANFLWFIKFERSFQEKELQMLQNSVQISAEIVDFARWSMNRIRAKDGGEE